MSQIKPAVIDVYEGRPVWTVARVQNADGTYPVLADVTAIELKVFDHGDVDANFPVLVEPITASASNWFDTLQTDGYWEEDADGYNFRHMLDGETVFMEGGRNYRLEYHVTTSTFGLHTPVTIARVKSLYGV